MRLNSWSTNCLTLLLLGAACLSVQGVQGLKPHTDFAEAETATLAASCALPNSKEDLPKLDPKQQQAIQVVLNQQVAGWNQGDIGQFMEGYWKSEQLTFASGGQVTRGWQQTHDRYQDRYSPPDKMGHLWFDGLEFQGIADDAALVLGQWHLKDVEGKVAEGNFSLVMKKFSDGWKVIHDHTSLREPKKESTEEKNN